MPTTAIALLVEALAGGGAAAIAAAAAAERAAVVAGTSSMPSRSRAAMRSSSRWYRAGQVGRR